jgi:hypothetical protein
MKRLFALLLIAIAMIGSARALPGELSLWVDGAKGDDLNDCTELHPCKEIQGAVSKITGMFAWISVAGWSGTYAAVDLSHHKTVTIKGDCNDPSQTKVAGLTAQDFVVLGVQCLSTPSVTARQHVVADVYRVPLSRNIRIPCERSDKQSNQLYGWYCHHGRCDQSHERLAQFLHFSDG